MPGPQLTFFCELGATDLERLFASAPLMQELAELRARLSLGILDLSRERAGVVRRLNRAGIPVVAWLLLPEEQGYWFNAGNAAQAMARYQEFGAWTATHSLKWAGIGLDIEPDMREIRQLQAGRWRSLPALLARTVDGSRLRWARQTYKGLVAQAHADRYRVESYQIPFIVDERRARSTLLQRLGGLVDLPVDREVLMLYTSLLRPHGVGILLSYAHEAPAIGVGSTGGGVTLGGIERIASLNWNELSRDLRLAAHRCNDIYIFSLEGCVAHGFLGRLRDFDWEQPAIVPVEAVARAQRARRILHAALWAGAHPLYVWGAIVVGLLLISRLRPREV